MTARDLVEALSPDMAGDLPQARMSFDAFHNSLRILLNIDRDELERDGILKPADNDAWSEFRRDPFRFFIRSDDATAMKLWAIILLRQYRR